MPTKCCNMPLSSAGAERFVWGEKHAALTYDSCGVWGDSICGRSECESFGPKQGVDRICCIAIMPYTEVQDWHDVRKECWGRALNDNVSDKP
jgi:hypothetical protein